MWWMMVPLSVCLAVRPVSLKNRVWLGNYWISISCFRAKVLATPKDVRPSRPLLRFDVWTVSLSPTMQVILSVTSWILQSSWSLFPPPLPFHVISICRTCCLGCLGFALVFSARMLHIKTHNQKQWKKIPLDNHWTLVLSCKCDNRYKSNGYL